MSRRRLVAVALALLAVVAVPSAVAAPDDAVTVEQSLAADSVAPGESVGLTATVAVEDVDAPAINVSVPANWTVEVVDDGDSDASFGSAWLWRDGDEHTVELTLGIPETADGGSYEVAATGSGIYQDTGDRVTDRTSDEVEVGGPVAVTADAGENRTVTPETSVELDGSGSTAPDDTELTYRWTQVGGPSVALAENGTTTPSFVAPEVTDTATLAFELSVANANGTTDTDRVAVTVERPNRSPTARAGDDRSVAPETTVELNGTGSSDPDGDDLAFAWRQVDGPNVTLTDARTATPAFEAPAGNDTRLTFQMAVSDGTAEAVTDSVVVTVVDTNAAPTAVTGPDRRGDPGTTMELTGTGSTDPDGDDLDYEWTQVDGPSVDIDDADSATPAFVVPETDGETGLTFELTVSDGRETSTDRVTVTAGGAPPPVAEAGADRSVVEGSTVTLDGTADDAPDASYEWTQVGGPSVTLDDASARAPSFGTPAVDGETTLTFEFTVTDDRGRSDTDSTAVTVRPQSDGGDSGQSDGDDGGSDSGGSRDTNERDAGGGGGGGGGGGSAAPPEPSGPTVGIDRPDGRSAIVSVAAADDDPVGVTPKVADDGLRYERLGVTPSATPAIIRVAGPNNTSRAVVGIGPLGTLATDTAANATVTATFSVAGARLGDTDPASVTAFRVDDGTVTALNTTLVETSGGRHVYNVTTTAPAELTVGVPVPALSVTDVRTNVSEVDVGDPVEVTVTVTNAGRREGTETVRLGGAGTTANRTVTLAAGETTETTFVRRFESAGDRTVRAGDASATVTVGEASTPASGGSATPSSAVGTDTGGRTDGQTTGGSGPGLGVAVTLVAVVVAALLARRR